MSIANIIGIILIFISGAIFGVALVLKLVYDK